MPELIDWKSPETREPEGYDEDMARFGDFIEADSVSEMAALDFMRRHPRRCFKRDTILKLMRKTAAIYSLVGTDGHRYEALLKRGMIKEIQFDDCVGVELTAKGFLERSERLPYIGGPKLW